MLFICIFSDLLDINIFVIEFGFQSIASQLKLLTNPSKIFHVNLSNSMIEENEKSSLMKNEPIFAAIMKSIYPCNFKLIILILYK